ncbi:hypothetical protein SynWH8103_01208 [Synechococcus sp. WH 8103]|nr:hypothetical protein SynWH8103_01208 [Synechococcus sp. WH 8103]
MHWKKPAAGSRPGGFSSDLNLTVLSDQDRPVEPRCVTRSG